MIDPAAGAIHDPVSAPQLPLPSVRRVRVLVVALALGVAWACLPFFPGLLGAGVLAVLGKRAGAALALLIIGAVICSNVDNIIRPFIFRRVSGVHPMVSLLGAFAGVKAMGLIGLLVGPLALTLFLEILVLHEEDFASEDTRAHSDAGNTRSP
jgi:predicted PurR-regulated permease PerM